MGTWTSASLYQKHFAVYVGKIECRAKLDPTWANSVHFGL